MTPEQMIAVRVLEKHRLAVPVDVEGLVAQFADMEEDFLPPGVDAVLVNNPVVRARPLIVVEKNQLPARKRFTLAHELGHLLIPWHLGVVGCHPTAFEDWGGQIYQEGESEANRFASELLMPSSWLKLVVENASGLREVYDWLATADASDAAASLALARCMPPGRIIAQVDASGIVLVAAVSPGTAVSAPRRGSKVRESQYDGLSAVHESLARPRSVIHRWILPEEDSLSGSDGEGSAEILARIMRRGLPDEQMVKASQVLAGVVGYANSKFKFSGQTEGQFISVLRQRLLGREDFKWLTGDAEFSKFLAVKARELVGRGR
ncbi:ImmA/IrrE family metallo-endopeptidase [Corallococcus sp. BB11-1]|uniref:ImmA/IrrE family metallo-endopeptidase n=1 Tax=Corallococcus sp. BB11-1 TaxID=2996783 RepID=UPI0022712ECF|nr:ImmA/IrrE family metallo-endopeptidase [Corallococcus sp. BB11-1]MCY1036216.1 ImmA/IrrE family metallo-endopeptidase [Corallococcus sp. BB11-1]